MRIDPPPALAPVSVHTVAAGFRSALGLALTIVAACTLVRAQPAPEETLPWLKIADARVVRADTGEPVRLRGVNLDRFYFSWEEDPAVVATYCGAADLARLARAGVTLVRLGFHWREVLGPEPEVAQSLARLDETIAACAANRIHVVLDLRLPPGNREINPLDFTFWDDPRHAEHLVRLWRTLARRYAAEPAILGYDLFNEPVPPDPDEWWRLANRLIAAVRSEDTRHILVVQPPLLEGEGFRKVADPQVLYSFHFYEPMLLTHQGAWWVGDVPPPMGVAYPGTIPEEEEVGNDDGPSLQGDAAEWKKIESEERTAPEEAAWLALVIFAEGAVEEVRFDDLEVDEDGVPVPVPNAGFEDESEVTPGAPFLWRPAQEIDGEPDWLEEGRGGTRCLALLGVESKASWTNWGDPIPEAYVAVTPGRRYRVRAWVRAQGNRGAVGVSLSWLKRKEVPWDRERLAGELRKALTWGRENRVAMYCGEFGCTRGHRGAQAAYVADLASLLNEAGVPWTLWTFRDPNPEEQTGAFGLYFGPAEGGTAKCMRNEELWDAFRKALK